MIREDIKPGVMYYMKHKKDVFNNYVEAEMLKPGTLVTVNGISSDQYRLEEDDLYLYTDDMFDPETIEFLITINN